MQKKKALPDPLERDPRGEFDGRYDVTDRESWPGAVLLADEIKYYCENPDSPMIAPFKLEDLRAASYSLRLGPEIRVGGRTKDIQNAKVILEPHQGAVVSTLEKLNIPRFLIARWSLRVRTIYEGLLWTGGLQVDPGWRGRLFCPIYNLSNEEVELTFGEQFFTMDFIRTTALTDDYYAIVRDYRKTRYPSAEEDPTIAEYDKLRIQSAPYEKLAEVQDIEDEVKQIRTTLLSGIGILFAAIGAVVAGLTIFTATSDVNGASFDQPWFSLSVAASLGAVLVALAALALTWSIHGRLTAIQTGFRKGGGLGFVLATVLLVVIFVLLGFLLATPWDSEASSTDGTPIVVDTMTPTAEAGTPAP